MHWFPSLHKRFYALILTDFHFFGKGEMGKPVRIENPDEETKKKIGKAQFPLFAVYSLLWNRCSSSRTWSGADK